MIVIVAGEVVMKMFLAVTEARVVGKVAEKTLLERGTSLPLMVRVKVQVPPPPGYP